MKRAMLCHLLQDQPFPASMINVFLGMRIVQPEKDIWRKWWQSKMNWALGTHSMLATRMYTDWCPTWPSWSDCISSPWILTLQKMNGICSRVEFKQIFLVWTLMNQIWIEQSRRNRRGSIYSKSNLLPLIATPIKIEFFQNENEHSHDKIYKMNW